MIGGIVAHADLTDGEHLDEVLDAHAALGQGLFRGIRHAGAHDPHPGCADHPRPGPAGLYSDPAFRAGVARLGERGLTYDTWHFHHQNRDFAALARAVPETTMVLDHFGTPLGVGEYAGRREEIFDDWRVSIAEIAACPNVFAKLGGMAMPDNGFGWHQAARPPTSDEFVAQQRPYYLHTIECVRSRTLHVRVELPGRPVLAFVPGAVERPQEDRGAVLRRRTGRDVLRHGGPRVPHRHLIGRVHAVRFL